MYASSLTKSNSSSCGTRSAPPATTGQYRRRTATRSDIEPEAGFTRAGGSQSNFVSIELQRLLDGQGLAPPGADEQPGLHLAAHAGEHLGVGPSLCDGLGVGDATARLHRPAQENAAGGH